MKEMAISVTQAARKFSDCVNRVRYQGASFILHKNGVPVARIVPVESPLSAQPEQMAVARSSVRNEAPQDEKEAPTATSGLEEPGAVQQPSTPPRRPVLNW